MPKQEQFCRSFHSLSDLRSWLSPASRKAPGGDRSTVHEPTPGGVAALPLWRAELARRPLRRVVSWRVYEIRTNPHAPALCAFTETLECGHHGPERLLFDGVAPAQRRRCRTCGERRIE